VGRRDVDDRVALPVQQGEGHQRVAVPDADRVAGWVHARSLQRGDEVRLREQRVAVVVDLARAPDARDGGGVAWRQRRGRESLHRA